MFFNPSTVTKPKGFVSRKEKWKWVRGYVGHYEVSTFGRVRSLDRIEICQNGQIRRRKGRVLKHRLDGKHCNVSLCKNGKIQFKAVHRLVLEAFVGPCPEGMIARHFPGRNPANNYLNNLQWGTPTQNQFDRHFHGTDGRGENNIRAKITEKDVRRMRKLRNRGWILTDLAKEFNLHFGTVQSIVTGRTWRHVQ